MIKITKKRFLTILPVNIAIIIVMAVLICSAVSDAIEAKKIEDALAGGYEGILSYENRPDYGAFVSKEAFMEVMTSVYAMDSEMMRNRSKEYVSLCTLLLAVGAGINFLYFLKD